MIAIAVGEPVITLHVHESLIRSKSHFFAAALSQDWKEAQEKVVRLPDDRPDIVKLYIKWLYSGKLLVKWTTELQEFERHIGPLEYYTLACLYIFGEKCCDVTFKNAVVASFVGRMDTKIGDTCWYPVGKAVDIIYNGTTAASPMRQLLIDTHLWLGHAPWISGQPLDDQNKEFLHDLISSMYRTSSRTGKEVVVSNYLEEEKHSE